MEFHWILPQTLLSAAMKCLTCTHIFVIHGTFPFTALQQTKPSRLPVWLSIPPKSKKTKMETHQPNNSMTNTPPKSVSTVSERINVFYCQKLINFEKCVGFVKEKKKKHTLKCPFPYSLCIGQDFCDCWWFKKITNRNKSSKLFSQTGQAWVTSRQKRETKQTS